MKKIWLLFFWTFFYALFATAFFYILFGFDIWAAAHWHKLARATLRGLGGLTFGASLLAALPVYLAAAVFTWRNEKMPFGIPLFSGKKKEAETLDADAGSSPENQIVFPDTLPDELREPYIRIHSGLLAKNAMDFLKGDIRQTRGAAEPAARFASAFGSATSAQPVVETASGAMMPVPESFDAIPDDESASSAPPVFRELDFGGTDSGESENADTPLVFDEQDGEKVATYVFNDPDFWVADDTNDWFATGKQIESPIKLLLDSGADRKVLVFETKNIMNLETLIPSWEKLGIEIVSD